jgi:hypothetical protein
LADLLSLSDFAAWRSMLGLNWENNNPVVDQPNNQ